MKTFKTIALLILVFIFMIGCESNKTQQTVESNQIEEKETDSEDNLIEETIDSTSKLIDKLDTLEKINTKKEDIINTYTKYFEETGVPFEVTPNRNIILGTTYEYSILDTKYLVAEFVSSTYYPDDDVIKTAVNMNFEYHLEKGLDATNSHIMLLYKFLSDTGDYLSIDQMISDMENNSEKTGVGYKWENRTSGKGNVGVIEFASYYEEVCDYNDEMSYVEFDSLDARTQKISEYFNLVNQKLSESGYGGVSEYGVSDNGIVRATIMDGWENDTYARKIDNDLGLVVRFKLNVLPEYLEYSINFVKTYIDCAYEIFQFEEGIPSEILAKDIVTRAKLIKYSDETDCIRLYRGTEDYQDVKFPCNNLLGKDVNPISNIQYYQSGYFIDSLGLYSKQKNSIIIEYYIPIKVEGLQNKG